MSDYNGMTCCGCQRKSVLNVCFTLRISIHHREMYDRKNRFAIVADDVKNVLQSTLSHYPQDRKTLSDIVKARIDSTQENGTVTEHMG